MSKRSDGEKAAALRKAHSMNPRATAVTDPSFVAGNPFFDPRDIVQVKYEMLRRVLQDGQSVTRAAACFGFSRASFYKAQRAFERAGLPGLTPQRPGPRRAHKLSADVMTGVLQALDQNPSLRASDLARLLKLRFGLVVHPRSIERALARRQKPTRPKPSS